MSDSKPHTPKISPEVIDLADKIAAHLTVDSATGVGTESCNNYNAHLPDGLTPEIVQQVAEYDTDFVAASGLAFGRKVIEAMGTNEALNRASIEMQGGGRFDRVAHTMDRSKTYTNHLGGTKEQIEKHGVLTTTLTTQAAKPTGDLRSVRLTLQEQGVAQLTAKKAPC
jgi:hypothetical protein